MSTAARALPGASDSPVGSRPEALSRVVLNGKAYDVMPLELDGTDGVCGMLDGHDEDSDSPWSMSFWLPADAVADLEERDARGGRLDEGADGSGHPKRQAESESPRATGDSP